MKNDARASRKCNIIENLTDGAPSFFNDFTLKVRICRILASGPFPLQPYYSRGRNVKFYSTSHVNTFLMMTNDRGERCHSEKASQIKKKRFFTFFHFFDASVIFFKKFVKKSFSCFFKFFIQTSYIFLSSY